MQILNVTQLGYSNWSINSGIFQSSLAQEVTTGADGCITVRTPNTINVTCPKDKQPTAPNTQGQGQGQDNISNLPPVTETKDNRGNTILSSEDKSKKIDVESLIPEGLSEKDKMFFRGYMQGYVAALEIPSKAITYADALSRNPIGMSPASTARIPGGSEAYSIGFAMGVNDAFAALDLAKKLQFDTFEALGVLQPKPVPLPA